MANQTDFKSLMAGEFGQLTGAQLWALVKFAKDVRLRRKSNVAFNNQMNLIFGDYAQFQTVTKTRQNRYTGQPESYPGLQIVMKDRTIHDSEENEE